MEAAEAPLAVIFMAVRTAMKMEHKLSAGIAGVVQSVSTEAGATVDQGDALVVVEPQGG